MQAIAGVAIAPTKSRPASSLYKPPPIVNPSSSNDEAMRYYKSSGGHIPKTVVFNENANIAHNRSPSPSAIPRRPDTATRMAQEVDESLPRVLFTAKDIPQSPNHKY